MKSRLLIVTITALGFANLSGPLAGFVAPSAFEAGHQTELSSLARPPKKVTQARSKSPLALAGAQKVSGAKFDEVLPKPRARSRARATKRVSVSFDGPSTAATPIPQDKFYADMRNSKAGRSSLPLNVDESKSATKAETQVVVNNSYRPRRASEAWSNTEEEDAPVVSRPAPRISNQSLSTRYSRARSRSGVTLIPFGGVSYTQNVVQGSFVDAGGGTTSSTEVSGKPGFSLGVLVDFGESLFTVQTGLVYIQEGAVVKITGRDYYGDPFSADAKISSHFIGIPLLAKVNIETPGSNRLFLKGGVVPVYMTNMDLQSTTQYIDNYGRPQTERYSGSRDNDIRRFNLLGQLGAGVTFPVDETFDIRIEGSYLRSFMALSTGSYREDMYTQSFTSTLGFGIHL